MRVGLLIDRSTVTRWQANALARLGHGDELLLYNCRNPPKPRRRLRHWPYYMLNLVSLRSALTRRVPLPASIATAPAMDFECLHDGAWQRLPDELIGRLVADDLDVIVKFGLGLLRVPGRDRLPTPILSYHHGDPRHFRGRPAGFYELLGGRRTVGQVVQILSNQLDAGQPVAFGETRVHAYSYRRTMEEAYATSPLLLPTALAAIRRGLTLDLPPEGKVTRLPPAWTVARFLAQRAAAKLRRLAYGAFVEKVWQVAHAPIAPGFPSLRQFPPAGSWQTVERPAEFRFLADPFPHPQAEGILVEALRSDTGLGEILHIHPGGPTSLLRGGGHFSYPASVVTAGGVFLVPEICEWSTPQIYRLDGDGAWPAGPLGLNQPARLVDPTLFERDGTMYLFANIYSEGDFILRLWTAHSLHDRFNEHPASPILISPRGARMGGLLIERGGSIYRVGQDGSGRYGDGVLLFRIDALSRTDFRETPIEELRFSHCRGPHTLNLGAHGVLFDFYRERADLLAGFRRFKGRLARRVPVSSDP